MTPHAHDLPPPVRRSVEDAVLATTRRFFDAYTQAGEGQMDWIVALVDPEWSGFGTSVNEHQETREDLEQNTRRDHSEVKTVEFRLLSMKPFALSANSGLAYGTLELDATVEEGRTFTIGCRFTFVLRLHEGRWKMVHGHLSRPDSDQPVGEASPWSTMRDRNKQLERLVAERTAELEAAQAQLVHQEKMASLGALTAGIAHEIKNPLNFVANFAQMNAELADDLAEATGETERAEIVADLRDNAARIAEHSARADAIVSGMMQHARGGTGDRQPVDLNALVREYAEHARHALLARDPDADAEVDLTLDLGDDAGTVDAVPQEIGRVLVALLSNAFDAVREGTEAGLVTVRTRRSGGHVEVRVADDGPGIAPDALGRVFEPFYTTKPTGQGHTGLGLSLAHDAVVQGHGGTLAAESTDGEGAVFTMGLPCRA